MFKFTTDGSSENNGVLATLSLQTSDTGTTDLSGDGPLPFKATDTVIRPSHFELALDNSGAEPLDLETNDLTLEEVAATFVAMSQSFGQGHWISIEFEEYREYCKPRAVPNSERNLFRELVKKKVLVIGQNCRYSIGPNLPWFLSGKCTNFPASMAA